MDASDTNNANSAKEPYLPVMEKVGDLAIPLAPKDVASAKLDDGALTDLAVRYAFTVPHFTTESTAKRLHLSLPLTAEVLEQLCREGLAEETLRVSHYNCHYRISQRGREQAERSFNLCGYVGPAPVRLEAYASLLRWQFSNTPRVRPKHVVAALSGLVLPQKAIHLAGLAASSGRSLFIYGPPGNGKSSVGRQIHASLVGDYWIPYCISVGNEIVRIFDEQMHHPVDLPEAQTSKMDRRWVRIKRPFVVVGGELTIEMLDLVYSPTMRYYEAPPHLKANGGVFLVDDFGRERVSPTQLLNRFITPMEHQLDYFTLSTSQKIQLPMRHVLIIATNLNPELVTDPAFLRRMGYRLYLGSPTPERYMEIFRGYAQKLGATVEDDALNRLMERYREQNRELRACEPRDLIERANDICQFQGTPLELTSKVLDLAWVGYFGSETAAKRDKSEAEAKRELIESDKV